MWLEIVKLFLEIAGGVFSFVTFMIAKKLYATEEVNARYFLDSVNTKRFDIDSRFSNGAISEEEAKREKNALDDKISYHYKVWTESSRLFRYLMFQIFVMTSILGLGCFN